MLVFISVCEKTGNLRTVQTVMGHAFTGVHKPKSARLGSVWLGR